jgi:hypothetical protein
MARQGDFSLEVKRQLANRAGHRCSMPSCRAPTSGPSDARVGLASNTGVAAHIRAASPGGPRYDPSQTAEERRSIENGIWLCSTDAKKIDDELRYTVELLESWRELAQDRAREELGRPVSKAPLAERRLIPHRRRLPSDPAGLRTGVHEFLIDVGAMLAWADHYELVRMFFYELALNAVEHGGATEVELSSTVSTVTLQADGAHFEIEQLRGGRGGGAAAVRDLDDYATGRFSPRYERGEGFNRWSLVDEIASNGANTPCGFAPEALREHPSARALEQIRALDECEDLHVYPGELWSYSDWIMFLETVGPELRGRHLLIHGLEKPSPIASRIERDFEGVFVVK